MTRNDQTARDVSRRTVLRAGAGTALTLGAGAATAMGGTKRNDRLYSIQVPENAVSPETPIDQRRARGLTKFVVDRAESTVRWTQLLADVENVTGVHVHRGGADENGPHLVELMNSGDSIDASRTLIDAGAVGEGDACTDTDFPAPTNCITQPGQPSGPPESVSFADVLGEIRSGQTYVQVHTTDGVMRGQIR